MKRTICILLIGLLFCACVEEGQPVNNEELIFNNSFQIRIPSYQYFDQDNQKTFFVSGDSVISGVDTISASPTFIWDSLNLTMKAVAVFKSPIVVENEQIQNPDSIVWEWNSGMGSEFSDKVQFFEGKNVSNGTEIAKSPLETGHYYWAVWAWGPTGVNILFSSKEKEFYVLN